MCYQHETCDGGPREQLSLVRPPSNLSEMDNHLEATDDGGGRANEGSGKANACDCCRR